MEFALSLKDGKVHHASRITYERAKKLNLVCPVCSEKVFKRVRAVPEISHCFCHHKGGSHECDLYHPSIFRNGAKRSHCLPQGQLFSKFIESISNDIRSLLIESRTTPPPIDEDRLSVLDEITEAMEFDADRESLYFVESSAKNTLKATGIDDCSKANQILETIAGFHRRPSARFIDSLVCAWSAYVLCSSDDIRALKKIVGAIIEDAAGFDRLSALYLSGIAAKYANEDIAWFGKHLKSACQGFALAAQNKSGMTAIKRKLSRLGFKFIGDYVFSPSGDASPVIGEKQLLELLARAEQKESDESASIPAPSHKTITVAPSRRLVAPKGLSSVPYRPLPKTTLTVLEGYSFPESPTRTVFSVDDGDWSPFEAGLTQLEKLGFVIGFGEVAAPNGNIFKTAWIGDILDLREYIRAHPEVLAASST